jgi:16S rRNA (cytosine1402-N4)-methyltransferase
MSDFETVHMPVLFEEVFASLELRPGKKVIDGTLGGGGHTLEIARRVSPGGLVVGIDRDAAALERVEPKIGELPVRMAQANFCDMPEVLDAVELTEVDGVLLDLGLSSDQLADRERGFSFHSPGPLDLRFDTTEGEPTWRWMNRLSEKKLADLIYNYGEERFSRRIARAILKCKQSKPISTADDLAQLCRRVIPKSRDSRRIDPATRTFQALRIASNEELKSLDIALKRIPDCLAIGGLVAIISFHSLEDRPVKEAFRTDERLEVITKRPIRPTDEEMDRNPRARSARLRVARRVEKKV